MKFPPDLLRQCWFLAGPTASGKTALGIQLAQRVNGEIISLDSMAVFRGMDIGTAKPTDAEQQQVRHHLIDVADPHEDFSTAEYLRHAHFACEDIITRSKVPIFVGGTGLYLRSVLRGVFEGPEADWGYRRQLQVESDKQDAGWLHQQLLQVDPQAATRLHPNDHRRLVRALEIYHVTGIPASQLQDEQPLGVECRPRHVYWLHPERTWLYERINQRVDQMISRGLVEECRALLERQPPIGRTARQALGYREIIDWLEARIETQKEAVELIQTRTRQFAKRQHTWFRNLEECHAIEIGPQSTIDGILSELVDTA